MSAAEITIDPTKNATKTRFIVRSLAKILRKANNTSHRVRYHLAAALPVRLISITWPPGRGGNHHKRQRADQPGAIPRMEHMRVWPARPVAKGSSRSASARRIDPVGQSRVKIKNPAAGEARRKRIGAVDGIAFGKAPWLDLLSRRHLPSRKNECTATAKSARSQIQIIIHSRHKHTLFSAIRSAFVAGFP
jgi:hypothetical protein